MNELKYYDTPINQYFAFLEENINKDTDLYKAAHSYMESVKSKFGSEKHDGPFLSVITRTQGKRKDMLDEALLGFSSQTDMDFEVLIMGHNLDEAGESSVNKSLDELPDYMKEKVRLIRVNGGTRTTPLNRGFEEANGEYIVILDDDDIVFDNWVEEFHSLAHENPGTVLHTYMLLQNWETVSRGDKHDIPRSCGSPDTIYCKKHDMFTQLAINYCPQGALAYPSYVFKEYGIRFDESLTTTEDWDFILRVCMLAGVSDRESITCTYRAWQNFANSQSAHNVKEWKRNYLNIRSKMDSAPLLMPKNFATESADYVFAKARSYDAKLFYFNGVGFSENCKFNSTSLDADEYVIAFKNTEKAGAVQKLRFDPYEYGQIIIKDLKIHIVDNDGNEYDFYEKDTRHNGVMTEDGLLFIRNDPQMYFDLPHPAVLTKVKVNYSIESRLSNYIVDKYIVDGKHSFLYRALRKVYRIVMGALHKIIGIFRK